MLKEHAQERIEQYLKVTLSNIRKALQKFNETGTQEYLGIANHELGRGYCFHEIYQATILIEDYDSKYMAELTELNQTYKETVPHGA